QGVGGASSGTATTSGTGTGGVSTGSSTGTTTNGAGGGPFCPSFGDPCTGCMSQACPTVFCGCAENPECLALISCVTACGGTQDCLQTCMTAHPDGISDVILLSDCAGTTCDSACGWGQAIDPCQKCIFNDCQDQANACFATPECGLLFQCLTSCAP